MSGLSHLLSPSNESNTYSAPPAPKTPYNPNPRTRISAPTTILIPISDYELEQCKHSINSLRTRPPAFVEPYYRIASTSKVTSPTHALPKRPLHAEVYNQGQSNGGGGYGGAERPLKRKKSNNDVLAVASHYNARPNVGVHMRKESPIIGLKNFNNWVKSVLIAKYGRRDGTQGPKVKVLDLGCGKGGDLLKWARAGTSEYIGIDLAERSIQQAAERWQGMRGPRFDAVFFAHDCFNRSISDVLQTVHIERPFDVVTMQFCMHYAFISEENACQMLENVSRYLRPGGTFLGTIPDSSNLLARLAAIPEEETDLTFGNEVYRITFEDRDVTPRFGHRYTFFLEDAVEAVPEYVVYWELFEDLASRYNLQVLYQSSFQQIFVNERMDPQFAQLLTRMKVVDSNGDTEMTFDQWEAANLYIGFALTKTE